MTARPEPVCYYTSFRTHAKCLELAVIHEKALKKVHQQKTDCTNNASNIYPHF